MFNKYLSPCEAAWRIFALDIHQKWVVVYRLTLHLPSEQHVRYKDGDKLKNVVKSRESLGTIFFA